MAIDFAKTDEIRSILLSAVDSSISTKGQIPTPSGAEVVSAGDTGHTAERTAHQLASPAKQPPPHARAPSRVLIPPPPPSSPPPSSPPPPPPPPPLAISVPDVDVAEPCDTAPMCGETNDHNNNQRPDTRTKAEGEENVGSGEGSEGEGSVQEAPSFAKRLTTARLLHQLIAHCEGHHDHNLHHHSKPPFRAFRDRIAHLKHIYCGEGGTALYIVHYILYNFVLFVHTPLILSVSHFFTRRFVGSCLST